MIDGNDGNLCGACAGAAVVFVGKTEIFGKFAKILTSDKKLTWIELKICSKGFNGCMWI